MPETDLDPTIVRQLMFNRILAFVQSLRCEHVIIAGHDAKTGTVKASLAGVSFVVNVDVVSSAST